MADPLPELTVSLGAALFAEENPPEAEPALPVPPVAPALPEPVLVPPAPVLEPQTDPGFWGLEAPQPTGLGVDQPWEDARTSVFDDVQLGAGAGAAAGLALGLPRGFEPPIDVEPPDGFDHEPA